MNVHTTVLLVGKTATCVEIPSEVVTAFGSSRRPAVCVTINGHTYRSTVAPWGGRFLLPISAEHRQGAGIAAGDDIELDITLDTEPRAVTVPADFAAVLDHDPDARRRFEGLSDSGRLRHILAIEGAKTAETRQRRIGKAIETLRARRA